MPIHPTGMQVYLYAKVFMARHRTTFRGKKKRNFGPPKCQIHMRNQKCVESMIGFILPVFKCLLLQLSRHPSPATCSMRSSLLTLCSNPAMLLATKYCDIQTGALNHRIEFVVLSVTFRWQIFGFHIISRTQLSTDDRRTFCSPRSSAITSNQAFY